MSNINLDDVVNALQQTQIDSDRENGVSFENQNLKLDTAETAQPIVEAILQCKDLQYLNLAGNTLGVDAAAALAKALEKHPEFKQALWKDLFTGRLKEEIPKALEHLGNGLITANARLTLLDLSDNAFGPIGVAGLAFLLQSRACYSLHTLRLNNNGLGIGGGQMLAKALIDCYKNSEKEGIKFALKVFIAGRNRLEDKGAKALAKVFETIGSLEEIAMPQNGIYFKGITALAEAFEKNENLEVLNLNDNTIGPKGSYALAKAFGGLKKLRVINLGDCLLKNRGAELIAESLCNNHPNLEELIVESNEIQSSGGTAIAAALADKASLRELNLSANHLGSEGIADIRSIMEDGGHEDSVLNVDEDDSDVSVDEDEDEDDEDEENSVDVTDQDEELDDEENEYDDDIVDLDEDDDDEEEEIDISSKEISLTTIPSKNITVDDFLKSPTADNFLALGDQRTTLLLNEAKKMPEETFLDGFIPILMKVSGLVENSNKQIIDEALSTSDILFHELFQWGQKTGQNSLMNNMLLVGLGLIKSEDKKFKLNWNLQGCFFALENACKKQYFPADTKTALKIFLAKSTKINPTIKAKLQNTLN